VGLEGYTIVLKENLVPSPGDRGSSGFGGGGVGVLTINGGPDFVKRQQTGRGKGVQVRWGLCKCIPIAVSVIWATVGNSSVLNFTFLLPSAQIGETGGGSSGTKGFRKWLFYQQAGKAV